MLFILCLILKHKFFVLSWIATKYIDISVWIKFNFIALILHYRIILQIILSSVASNRVSKSLLSKFSSIPFLLIRLHDNWNESRICLRDIDFEIEFLDGWLWCRNGKMFMNHKKIWNLLTHYLVSFYRIQFRFAWLPSDPAFTKMYRVNFGIHPFPVKYKLSLIDPPSGIFKMVRLSKIDDLIDYVFKKHTRWINCSYIFLTSMDINNSIHMTHDD